jgi:hypothetical protein
VNVELGTATIKQSFIMAVASHSIDVYALLPDKVATGPELDVNPTNWRWVHCLTLPLDTLNTLQFSRRLYPWIRYAIGVVVGAEGVLSTTPDSLSAVDEDNIPPTESVKLYYHISDEEKRRTFPVNPHIANSHVTSSAPSTRRDDFRDEVAKRDGGRCVLTGLGTIYCTAVHLLSQSKGDMVCHSYSKSGITHHCNRGSIFQLIPSAVVVTLTTLYMTLTVSETAFFSTTWLTPCWVKI